MKAKLRKPDPVRPTPPLLQTWIDAPLHGSTIPLDLYSIVYHGASDSGIDMFQVRIDGTVLDESGPKSTGSGGSQYGALFMGESDWLPWAPGTFMISVRAMSGSSFGPYAYAEVTVDDNFELMLSTPPAILTLTPTKGLPILTPPTIPAPSPSPTSTATFTPTPVQVSEGVQDPNFSSDTFYYRGSCSPKELTIEVSVQDPSVYSVVLFHRLKDINSGETTGWTNVPMTPMGGGYFKRTLQSESDIPGFNRFLRSYLQVQIVATKQNGSEIGRTGVLSEVVLETCAASIR